MTNWPGIAGNKVVKRPEVLARARETCISKTQLVKSKKRLKKQNGEHEREAALLA